MSDEQLQPDPIMAALLEEYAALAAESTDFGPDEDSQLVEHHVRMLARCDREIASIKAWAATETARLTRKRDAIQSYFGYKAAAATARLTAGGKKKSITFPWGVAGFRSAGKAGLDYIPENKDELIKWAEEHCPAAVSETDPQPTKGIKKVELAEWMIAHKAETPLAQVLAPGRQDFYVKTKADSDE